MLRTLAALLALSSSSVLAATPSQAFHDAVRRAAPAAVQLSPYAYGAENAVIEYDRNGDTPTLTVSGEIGDVPPRAPVLRAAGALSRTWCGVQTSQRLDMTEWYLLGVKRDVDRKQGKRRSSLVTARIGGCQLMLVTEGPDVLILLSREPGAAVWPPRLLD